MLCSGHKETEAAIFCTQCRLAFCKECEAKHNLIFSEHKTVPAGSVTEFDVVSGKCDHHPSYPLDVFCNDCICTKKPESLHSYSASHFFFPPPPFFKSHMLHPLRERRVAQWTHSRSVGRVPELSRGYLRKLFQCPCIRVFERWSCATVVRRKNYKNSYKHRKSKRGRETRVRQDQESR